MKKNIFSLLAISSLLSINLNSAAIAQNLGSPGFTWTGDFNGDGVTDYASAKGLI